MKMIKGDEANVGLTVILTQATFSKLVKSSGLSMEQWSAKVTDLIEKDKP
jgi:hypothetical protein